MKNLNQSRQEALLDSIRLTQRPSKVLEVTGESSDPGCRALTYAMKVLGDGRSIVAGEGTFGDLLETNNIASREVRTPKDLTRSTRAMLIAFTERDNHPLAVHRHGTQTLAFDGVDGSLQPLAPDLALKPYAYELYASLHRLDQIGLDRILVEAPPAEPAWAAIRDRLRKSAAGAGCSQDAKGPRS